MTIEWLHRGEYLIRYSPEESAQLLDQVFKQVFSSNYFTEVNGVLVMEPEFEDQSWQAVVLPGDAFTCYQSRNWNHAKDGPFDSLTEAEAEDWEYRNIINDSLTPLFEILLERGSKEILGALGGVPPANREVVGVAPSRAFLDGVQAICEPCNDVLLTSRDADWGIVSCNEDGAILAGKEPFMQEFVRRSGGLDTLKSRTDKYALGKNDPNDPTVIRREFFSLYAAIGWEPPE